MRSAEDIAFHVTLFIAAKKGSFVNYYMVYSPLITIYMFTSYFLSHLHESHPASNINKHTR